LLLRNKGGDLVLVDFGLARLTGMDASSEGRGTLAYMAPEQRHGVITAASDVHAAGVILIELLLGTPAGSAWLFDRARLIRGEAHWDGILPPQLTTALGARTSRLRDLALAMMATNAADRPSAAEAVRVLSSI